MDATQSLSESVPHQRHEAALPQLRRYLRAITGDQLAGDRMAAGLWSTMPQKARGQRDPARFLSGATRAWRRSAGGRKAPPFSDRALLASTPPGLSLPRQAGVLIDVFGLTVHEAATVLDRSEGEVTRILSATRAERRAPLALDVLVVEDDPIIAQHLASIAEAQGARVEVAFGFKQADAAAARRAPRIAICDYDLGEGPTGVDVVQHLASEHDTTCIFVTAYPELVLRGADGEPPFVLGKPFSERAVAAALHYAARTRRPELLAA